MVNVGDKVFVPNVSTGTPICFRITPPDIGDTAILLPSSSPVLTKHLPVTQGDSVYVFYDGIQWTTVSTTAANINIPDGFAYGKVHTITGSPDGDLTNYPVQIVIFAGTGTDSGNNVYLNGSAGSWPYDVAFYHGTKKLKQFREFTYSTTLVSYWVQLDHIAANSTYPLTMVWGKSGISVADSDNSVFPLFCDLCDNRDRWTLTGTVTQYSGYFRVGGAGSSAVSDTSFGVNTAVRALLSPSAVGTTLEGINFGYYLDSNNYCLLSIRGVAIPGHTIALSNNGATSTAAVTWATGQAVYEFQRRSNSLTAIVQAVNTGAIARNVTLNASCNTADMPLRAWTGGTNTLSVYTVFVRPCATNEPTHGAWVKVPYEYQYAKDTNIKISSANSAYQMKFVIHRGNGGDYKENVYLNNNSLHWPYDIRFTNLTTSQSLPHWIETYDENVAVVWVKVDSITTIPEYTPIRIWYGGKSSVSSGSDTFIFFDDMSGDLSKWTVTGNATITNGVCTVNGSTPDSSISSLTTAGNYTSIRASINPSAVGTSADSISFGWWYDASNYSLIQILGSTTPGGNIISSLAGATNSAAFTMSANTEQIIELKRATYLYADIYQDSAAMSSIENAYIASNQYNSNMNVYALAHTTGQTLGLNWVFVRKFVLNEPYVEGNWSLTVPEPAHEKSHIINSDQIIDDYQMMFIVHRGTGTDNGNEFYLNGNSLSWPYDIFFYAGSGSLDGIIYPSWIESYTDTGNIENDVAIIWVKIYVISITGVTIKVKYGQTNSSTYDSQSAGKSVFNLFDDFIGDTLDEKSIQTPYGLWVYSGANETISIANSCVTITSDGNNCILYNNQYTAVNQIAIRARLKTSHFNNTSYNEGFGFDGISGQDAMAYFCSSNATFNGYFVNDNNGTATTSAISNWTADTFAIVDICVRTTGIGTEYTINNGTPVIISSNVPTNSIDLRVLVGGSAGSSVTVDWIAQRNIIYANLTHGSWTDLS